MYFTFTAKRFCLVAASLFALASCGGGGEPAPSALGGVNEVPVVTPPVNEPNAKIPVVGYITYGSMTKPEISGIIVGDRTQFTVIGANFPPTAEMKIEGVATCEKPVVVRAEADRSEFKQECLIGGEPGYRQVAVLTKANGDMIGTMTGLEVVVKFHTVYVNASDTVPYVREVITNPIEPEAGQSFTIDVIGDNLPSDISQQFARNSYDLPGCTSVVGGTPSKRSFSCLVNRLGRHVYSFHSANGLTFSSSVLYADYSGQSIVDIVPAGGRFARVQKAGGGTYELTECVQDGMNGQIWEGKPLTGMRAASTQFDKGSDLVARMSSYRDSVNASALCGFSDWRVPEDQELRLLAKGNKAKPNYSVEWLPNTLPGYYRSWIFSPPSMRSPLPIDQWDNLTVYFGSDRDLSPTKEYLRLVRGPVSRDVYWNN